MAIVLGTSLSADSFPTAESETPFWRSLIRSPAPYRTSTCRKEKRISNQTPVISYQAMQTAGVSSLCRKSSTAAQFWVLWRSRCLKKNRWLPNTVDLRKNSLRMTLRRSVYSSSKGVNKHKPGLGTKTLGNCANTSEGKNKWLLVRTPTSLSISHY